MKLFAIRSAAVAIVLSLLAACGSSDMDAGTPVADTSAPAQPVILDPAGNEGLAGMQPPPSNGQNPTPDCEPENCQGLRIIDGNAEAFRFEAISRTDAQDSSST